MTKHSVSTKEKLSKRAAGLDLSFSLAMTLKKETRLPVSEKKLMAAAKKVLGASYHLSVVICGDALSQRLNASYREKNKPANVLSFPLSRSEGELFINLKKVRSEASRYEMDVPTFFAYLFIHGCLHLKGMDHGSTMERTEKRLLNQLFNNGRKNKNWH